MIEAVVLLFDLLQTLKLVSLMLSKDRALGTYFFQIDNTHNFQWLLMQQADIVVFLAFLWFFFFVIFLLFRVCIGCAIVGLRGVIGARDSGLLGNLGLLLLALLNRANQLFRLFVLLELLLFDDFWHVKRRVLERRFAFVRLDDFEENFVDGKLFQIVTLQLACGIILRTDDLELIFALREDEGFDACFTESVTAHAENAGCFLLGVLKVAQRAGKLAIHRSDYFDRVLINEKNFKNLKY